MRTYPADEFAAESMPNWMLDPALDPPEQCEASHTTWDMCLFCCQLPKNHDGPHEDHSRSSDGYLWD